MTPKLRTFLSLSMLWAAVVGLGMHAARVPLNSIFGIVILAVLYMPSPFVAALIADRRLVTERFRFPRGRMRTSLAFIAAPGVAVAGTVLAFLAAVFVLGELLHVPGFGDVATTAGELTAAARSIFGDALAESAGAPPPAGVLLLLGLWGAFVAGWTINGLVAMGEEYGWRGFLWDEVRHLGFVRANLLIGTFWGLWHAPLIVQGYNYPGHPALGVVAMIVFCIGMSLLLTALRLRSDGSLLPVAAAHGMFNSIAPIVLLLAPHTHPVLAGPVGTVMAVVAGVVGCLLRSADQRRARRSERTEHAPVVAEQPSRDTDSGSRTS